MKFSAILLSAALYLFSSVEAGISTNTPFKSVTWNGGAKEKVIWVDDGVAPSLADIGLTSVDLFAGGNTTQVFVANIAKVPATAKEADFTVPKSVGPPGDFYFIKYTAGTFTGFSGTFSIANVNGKIAGFDPKNPNPSGNSTTVTDPTNPTTPDPYGTPPATGAAPSGTDPYGSSPSSPSSPYGSAPSSSPSSSPTPSPASIPPTTPSANNAVSVQSPLPSSISSSDAVNLLPSFAGVATAAVAFALTYLY